MNYPPMILGVVGFCDSLTIRWFIVDLIWSNQEQIYSVTVCWYDAHLKIVIVIITVCLTIWIVLSSSRAPVDVIGYSPYI